MNYLDNMWLGRNILRELCAVMVGGVNVLLSRAWKHSQRCGGGKRICLRLWNSASAKLLSQGFFSRRDSIRNSQQARRIGVSDVRRARARKTSFQHRRSNNHHHRSGIVRIYEREVNLQNCNLRAVPVTKTTPHPLDQYIFSTLLKRTKHKGGSPKLHSRRNYYVNHSSLSPVYNERCIDTCVAAAAAAAALNTRNETLRSEDHQKSITLECDSSHSSNTITLPSFTFAPELPPRPLPRTKYQLPPPRPLPRTKPKSSSIHQKGAAIYSKPKKSRKQPPSTPSSSGVSSGEECGASSSQNTTKDTSSSYTDNTESITRDDASTHTDQSTLKIRHSSEDETKTRKCLVRRPSPKVDTSHACTNTTGNEEVGSEASSASWRWCTLPDIQANKIVKKVHYSKVDFEENADTPPPLPPKKGVSGMLVWLAFSILLLQDYQKFSVITGPLIDQRVIWFYCGVSKFYVHALQGSNQKLGF